MKKLAVLFSVFAMFSCGTVHADLNDGLIAYYPFNGNANDETGNGNNGIVSGATLTTDRLGNPDSAYDFDGNDHISLPNSPSLEPSVASFSIWFKTLQSGGNRKLINYSDGMCYHSYTFCLYDNVALFAVDHASPCGYFPRVLSNSILNDGIWHHVAGIHNGSNLYLYVDGVLQDDIQASSGHLATGQTVSIGDWINYGTPGTYSFIGSIDEVRIYNRVLSSSEIRELADAPEPVPTVSEWGMIIFFILLVGSATWVVRRRTRQESL